MNYYKVRLSIGGRTYHLQTTENMEYLHELADDLDRRITKIAQSDAAMDAATAAVLAGLDLLDEARRRMEDQSNLRLQIKSYADEATAANREAAELRQRLYDLQAEMDGQIRMELPAQEPVRPLWDPEDFEIVDEPDEF